MPRKEGQVIQRGENVFLIRLYRGEHLDPKTGKLKRRYVNETFRGTEPKAYKRLRDLLHDKDEGKLVEVTKLTLGPLGSVAEANPAARTILELTFKSVELYDIEGRMDVLEANLKRYAEKEAVREAEESSQAA